MGVFVGEVLGNRADAIVGNGLDIAENRTTEAVERAVDAIEDLTRRQRFFTINVNGDLDPVDVNVDDMSLPTAPTAPELNLVLPQFPSDITLDNIPDINLGVAPTFDSEAPTLVFPNAPEAFNVAAPGSAPVVDLGVAIPDAPVIVLPAVPTLRELNIPTAPTLDFPELDLPLPASNLVKPDNLFSWVDSAYTSDKLDTLCSVLIDRVQNAAGLPSAVENQIWDRARNREQLGENKGRSELLRDSAQQGFSRPAGAIQAALDANVLAFQGRVAELNREIAIKQAELAQDNVKHAIEQVSTLERALIDQHNQIQSRALDAAKFAQQTSIEIFNAEVGLFNLELQVYNAFINAFNSRVNLEIQKLEAFKIELEGQSILNQLNESDIRLYTARLTGLQTSVDVYRAQLQGIESVVDIENAKLTAYKTEVEAFATQAQAKTSEFNAFESAVKAETAKATSFEIEAKAFANRISAYAAQVNAETTRSDLKIKTEQLKITQQGLKLDTFSKTVDAKVLAYRTQVDEFQGKASIYNSQVGAESAKVNARISSINQKTQYAQVKSQVAIENAKLYLSNIERESRIALEVTKGAAEVSAQLAASSLSSLSYSAGINHNLSLQSSLNEQHSFDG